MKVGIMQPYFLPYIGYWQLMNAVDRYVIYDNIQFTKKSWIRRNRILSDGKDKLFTLPLKRDSDYLDIRERFLADTFDQEKKKMLRVIEASYKKAPMFEMVFPIIQEIFECDNRNLFEYIYFSICKIREYLEIKSKMIISSTLDIDFSLKGQDKVLAICECLNADEYYNAIGGQALYSYEAFEMRGIKLSFLQTGAIEYKQFGNEFQSNLSILDVMMFNSREQIQKMLNVFTLITE